MTNNDTFILAGFDWTPFFIWGSIAVAIWIIGLIFLITMDVKSTESYSVWGLFSYLWGMVGALIMIAVMAGVGSGESTAWNDKQRINALNERGYSDVLLVDTFVYDGFTANKDGEYVKGVFVQVDGEGERWTIEELTSGS